MILCCGEALIDLIPEGAKQDRVPYVGGAVLNTAIALGRLGQNVGMLTGVSSDEYGRMIAAFAEDSGVSMAPSVYSDRPTTLAIVTLVDGQATYDFRDEGSATRMIATQDLPDIADDVAALVFGGISLINAPVADTFAALCQAQAASKVTMIDINVRPGFISDPDNYRGRINAMLAVADIVKVSDEDMEWFQSGATDAQDALGRMRAACKGMLVVTKGAEGSTAFLPSGAEVSAPSPSTTVVDTVGAGDTFNAGLLDALQRAGALSKSGIAGLSTEVAETALNFAGRVAAVTVSRAGANPPWAHELG